MTPSPIAWLPDNAHADGTLLELLSACIDAWSETWLGARHSVAVLARPAVDALLVRPLTLTTERVGAAALGAAMLGIDAAHSGKLDKELLCRLADRSLADLSTRMVSLFGPPPISTLAPHVLNALAFDLALANDTPIARVLIAAHIEAARRKTALTATAPRSLGNFSQAIARQPIEVGAMIGAAKLKVGELKALGRGDIVLLDQGPAEHVALAVNRRAQSPPAFSIVQDGRDLKLRPASEDLRA